MEASGFGNYVAEYESILIIVSSFHMNFTHLVYNMDFVS